TSNVQSRTRPPRPPRSSTAASSSGAVAWRPPGKPRSGITLATLRHRPAPNCPRQHWFAACARRNPDYEEGEGPPAAQLLGPRLGLPRLVPPPLLCARGSDRNALARFRSEPRRIGA